MRVTVCQTDPRPEAIEASMRALAEHLTVEQPDLLLLPEMAFSDWLAAEREPDAARWADSVQSHLAWIDTFADLDVDVIIGTRPVVEPSGSRRNEAFVWSGVRPEPVGFHQKYYLPDEPGYWEHSWYDRGDRRFDTVRAGNARVGVMICTEIWFLEWARHYASSRVDLLVTPRATPRGSIDKWVAGGRVAAVCSGAYSLSSNLWLPEQTSAGDCAGVGWVIDPDGEVLATTSESDPFATVELDLHLTRRSKTTYPRYVPE